MDRLAALRERIFAFAASRYGRTIADDVAQEVMMLLHVKYPDKTEMSDLVPLAMQIARLTMIAMARKAARRGETTAVDVTEVPLADPAVNLALELEHRELIDRLERVLPTLGERCREIFRLKLDGHGFAEIQRQLNAASINTVYTWEARCREELRRRMMEARKLQ
jgi:RNA polymerase sigma-70 factor (ECF subfamily)